MFMTPCQSKCLTLTGKDITSLLLRDTCEVKSRAESGRLFANADLLITPTAPGPAFVFGTGRLVFLPNTAPWNLYGLPSISIPCGFTTEGLPIGM